MMDEIQKMMIASMYTYRLLRSTPHCPLNLWTLLRHHLRPVLHHLRPHLLLHHLLLVLLLRGLRRLHHLLLVLLLRE